MHPAQRREREPGDLQCGGLGAVHFCRTAPHRLHRPPCSRGLHQTSGKFFIEFRLLVARDGQSLALLTPSTRGWPLSGDGGDGLRRLAAGRQGTARMAELLFWQPSSHAAAPRRCDGTHTTVALHALHGAAHRSLLLRLLRAPCRSARRARRVRAGGSCAFACSASRGVRGHHACDGGASLAIRGPRIFRPLSPLSLHTPTHCPDRCCPPPLAARYLPRARCARPGGSNLPLPRGAAFPAVPPSPFVRAHALHPTLCVSPRASTPRAHDSILVPEEPPSHALRHADCASVRRGTAWAEPRHQHLRGPRQAKQPHTRVSGL